MSRYTHAKPGRFLQHQVRHVPTSSPCSFCNSYQAHFIWMPSVSGIARPCTERTCMYMRVQRRPIVLFIEPNVLRNHQATILVKPMLQISERDACVTQTSRAPGPASNIHYMSQVLNLVLYESSVEPCREHIEPGIARHIVECCTLLHEPGIILQGRRTTSDVLPAGRGGSQKIYMVVCL